MRRSVALRMCTLSPLFGFTATRAQAQTPVVRVGIGLIEAHAQGYYAQEMGFFRRSGIEVELEQLQLGAVVAAGVASGKLDTGQSNLFSLLAGREHGIGFEMIAPASLFDIHDPPHELLVVAPDSPIRTAKELNGQTIGLLSVAGAQTMFVKNWVDKNGGDSTTLKFLALGPDAMVTTLLQGRVAAVDLLDPQLTAAHGQVRGLGSTFAACAPRLLEGAWFTTTSWLNGHKDAAGRFAQAIVAAGQWGMAHPVEAAAILRKYIHVDEPRATVRFGTKLDPALIQPVADLGARYQMLTPMKATAMIWNGT